ncbi:hypothetical protein [Rhizobium leguminosarum]|uniref:hypothetical protein n=1 Tax=Rhizobium leguminosarum TaxID=384 RepID=UPI0012BC0266|nr:hypothetical protein [Rhizobium leguminosarum]WFT91117.1 hypothetical protein QA638_38650 [Rhizobium leguminosarum]
MSSRPSTPPPGWAQDTLTSNLEEFRGNQWATFHNKRSEMRDIIALDGMFDRLLHGAQNPTPILPATFLLRAHSAYRAAVSLAMGGQLYEVQSLLRLCLEHAAYGFFVGDDQAKWTRWMQRDDSDKNKEAVRREFSHGAIKHALKQADATVGGNFEKMYERLIDFGAHPNEQGYSMSTLLERHSNETRISALHLHGEGVPLDFSLKTVAQTAICALKIAHLIYPVRMDLAGITHDLEQIAKGY